MDSRGLSSSLFSSSGSGDVALLNERQVGFWKSDARNDHHGELFSREKLAAPEFQIPKSLRQYQSLLMNDEINYSSDAVGMEKATQCMIPQKKISNFNTNKARPQYESGIFSSSLSDLFNRQLKLSEESAEYSHSIDTFASHVENQDSLESFEEIEAQTIGNLLPRDDDLMAEMCDQKAPTVEDLDLFSSVGGLELGEDVSPSQDEFLGLSLNYVSGFNTISCEQIPSRTLLVTNVSTNVEDSELRDMFEQYGSVRTLTTAAKQKGYVMVSYFDIRAARDAMETLQNKSLFQKKLVIHYSIPKATDCDVDEATVVIFYLDPFISNDYLQNIFGYYGDIREIRDTSGRTRSKSIEYFDIRSAEAVLKAFNKNEIVERHIHLQPGISEPSRRYRPIMGSYPTQTQFVEPLYHHGFSTGTEKGFGLVGQRSSSVPTSHYAWSNSNHQEHHNMMFPNSPFGSDLSVSFRASPQILNTHHIVSAPTSHPSLWDGRNSLMARSLEISGFHPASVGNMRMNNMLPTDFDSQKVLPNFDGSVVDLSVGYKNTGIKPQKNERSFSGKGNVAPIFTSLDSTNERARNRRNDGNLPQTDKRHYELDVDRIMRGEDSRTTLMIKNIPNKYTSKMLLAAIDEHHKGTYDFVYLPIDFKNKCNVGYAFINMIDPGKIIPFYQSFNAKKWEKFNSEKVATLAYARIQGKSALVSHFQNSSLMNEDKRCRPILFSTDGPNAGDQVPFPTGHGLRNRTFMPQFSANDGKFKANEFSNGKV